MYAYRLALLGPPVLAGPQGDLACSSGDHWGLLFYLAAQPDRVFSRAHLATLFWPDRTEEGALRSLERCLRRMKSELPVWPIVSTGDSLSWDRGGAVWCDTVAFEELAAHGGVHSLDGAIQLRAGPFLEGFTLPQAPGFADWLLRERNRWDRRCLELLSALAVGCERAGQWKQLVDRAQQALIIDALDEHFHRHLMLGWAMQGKRDAALARFEELRLLLLKRLGQTPDPSTVSLRNAIAANRLAAMPTAANRIMADLSTAGAGTEPYVGRERPLRQGREWLRGSASRKNVLVVQGEAGSGKSRFVDALVTPLEQGAEPDGFTTVLRGACWQAHGGSVPLGPVLQALRPVLREVDITRFPLPQQWIEQMLWVLSPEPTLKRPSEDEQELGQQRVAESMARLLGMLPGRVLLVLEDLQWADPETVHLVGLLGHRRGDGTVSVLTTIRADEVTESTGELLAELESKGRLQRLELEPLDRPSVDELVEAFTGKCQPTLAEDLWRETHGHPQLGTEWLTAYEETGGGVDIGVPRHQATVLRIQALIRSRVQRLGAVAHRLLAAASLYPFGAPPYVLRYTAGLPEAEATGGLCELKARRFLRDTEDGWVRIRSELTRRVVYYDLRVNVKRDLHKRAFECLSDEGAHDTVSVAQQARHAFGAERWAKAAELWERAALQAANLYAFPTASRYLHLAIGSLERLPESDGRQSHRERLQRYLAEIATSESEADWIGPIVLETERAIGKDHPLKASVMEMAVAALRGQVRRMLGIVEWLMPLMRLTGRKEMVASGLAMSAFAHLLRGQLEEMARALTEALELLDNEVTHQTVLLLPSLVATEAALGRFGQAEQQIAVLAKSAHSAVPETLRQSTFLAVLAALAAERGQHRRALDLAREAARLARQGEHRFTEYLAQLSLGPAIAKLGDVEGGLEAQRQVIAMAQRMGTEYALDLAYVSLSQIFLAGGQAVRAEEAARIALKLARETGHRYGEAAAMQALGLALARAGDVDYGCEYLNHALTEFTAMRARPAIARCHAALARLVRSEALRWHHGSLAEAEFRVLGMEWDLRGGADP